MIPGNGQEQQARVQVDAGPDGVVMDFQGYITVWPPAMARALAKHLQQCADEVDAASAAGAKGIIIR